MIRSRIGAQWSCNIHFYILLYIDIFIYWNQINFNDMISSFCLSKNERKKNMDFSNDTNVSGTFFIFSHSTIWWIRYILIFIWVYRSFSQSLKRMKTVRNERILKRFSSHVNMNDLTNALFSILTVWIWCVFVYSVHLIGTFEIDSVYFESTKENSFFFFFFYQYRIINVRHRKNCTYKRIQCLFVQSDHFGMWIFSFLFFGLFESEFDCRMEYYLLEDKFV